MVCNHLSYLSGRQWIHSAKPFKILLQSLRTLSECICDMKAPSDSNWLKPWNASPCSSRAPPEVRSRWAVSVCLSFLIIVFGCISTRFKHSKHHSLQVYVAANSDTCKICESLRSCFQCVFKCKQMSTIFLMWRSLGICCSSNCSIHNIYLYLYNSNQISIF